jgi:tRNA-2-methylthio-N6-dimethylallyladenosine synthase
MDYYIKTFGCQMNISDSERIAGFLNKHRYTPTDDINQADLVIFNTCGVRQMAEDRVYGQIHNIAKHKSQIANRKPFVVLTGCLANRKDVQKRLQNKVDLFFPINQFNLFENFIIKNCLEIKNSDLFKNSKLKIKNLDAQNCDSSYLKIKPDYVSAYSANIPIMTGCNNFCSYCIVPYARGHEVSRPHQEILKEIRELLKKDFKEIILLGQNVNSYSDGKINFSKLLKKVNALPGKFWIRFTSNHPKDVTEEMIEAVAKCKKVCESFHLPIQAGSDEILRKMNRKYTAKEYLALTKKIKSAFRKNKPDLLAVITSDIIVGFPSETKKQFLDSADIMEKVGYDMVFFGQFSPRPGTVAWKLKDNVSKTEKERREQFLNEILKKTALKNSREFLNTTAEVLIEKQKDGIYFGKTRTLKNVKILSNKKDLIGKFAKVKITKASIWNLEGILI